MTTTKVICTLAFTLFSASSFANDNHEYAGADDGHTLHVEAPHEFGTQGVLSTNSFTNLNTHFDIMEMELARASSIKTPLKVKIDQLLKFDTPTKNKIYQTQRVLNAIFDSQEFYDAVKNHTYNGRRQFADNRGYDNEEIYHMIQLGKEKFSKSVDRMMNLKLKLYYENSSTVGWTYSNNDLIHCNKKYYAKYSEGQIARNLMHEWLHNMGFSHDAKVTSRRKYSVPYAIGDIVQKLARRY